MDLKRVLEGIKPYGNDKGVMDIAEIYVNGKYLAWDYGVYLEEKPEKEFFTREYKDIKKSNKKGSHRVLKDKYRRHKTTIGLVGIFDRPEKRDKFEEEVLKTLTEEEVSLIHYPWEKRVFNIVRINGVEVEDITQDIRLKKTEEGIKYINKKTVKYKIDFEVIMTLREVTNGRFVFQTLIKDTTNWGKEIPEHERMVNPKAQMEEESEYIVIMKNRSGMMIGDNKLPQLPIGILNPTLPEWRKGVNSLFRQKVPIIWLNSGKLPNVTVVVDGFNQTYSFEGFDFIRPLSEVILPQKGRISITSWGTLGVFDEQSTVYRAWELVK